jgi:hypothetical protein
MPKLRVYQLARELNRDNSEIIRELQHMGVPVTSHSNTVEDRLADKLSRELGVYVPDSEKVAAAGDDIVAVEAPEIEEHQAPPEPAHVEAEAPRIEAKAEPKVEPIVEAPVPVPEPKVAAPPAPPVAPPAPRHRPRRLPGRAACAARQPAAANEATPQGGRVICRPVSARRPASVTAAKPSLLQLARRCSKLSRNGAGRNIDYHWSAPGQQRRPPYQRLGAPGQARANVIRRA